MKTQLTKLLETEVAKSTTEVFPDGELLVRVEEDV